MASCNILQLDRQICSCSFLERLELVVMYHAEPHELLA